MYVRTAYLLTYLLYHHFLSLFLVEHRVAVKRVYLLTWLLTSLLTYLLIYLFTYLVTYVLTYASVEAYRVSADFFFSQTLLSCSENFYKN